MQTMSTVKKSIITAVCIALCYVLPLLFHGIQGAGQIFCPMHIPVFLCGLVCGWQFGLLCGLAGPALSSALCGMPPVSILPSMMIELAVYGLIAGSMMGGPLGKMLIERHHLLDTIVPEDDSLLVEEEIKHERHSSMYPAASFQLIIAMGIGTVLSKLLSLTGMTFPIYIGAMIAAACIRNLGEYGGKFTVYMGEINDIGGICLSLFLGMAMITLKIWQLAELALPLVVLLAGQTLFMILYSFAIVYNVMGRDYDAAVIVSGTCGFGMGATPNAMANMQAVCDKYSPSVKAYLLIPLVGSLFADFINSLVITVFINFI